MPEIQKIPKVKPMISSSFNMNEKEFNTLRQMVFDHCGIEVRPQKKQLMVNRLAKRLRHLGLQTFSEYLHYLEKGNHRDQEFIELIDAITTNKTDFFREPKHFQFLEETVLPEIISTMPNKTKSIKVWSAACSSGEEPYTTSICLSEALNKHYGWSFDITASDISETILRQAITGIYEESKVSPIPANLLRKYFLRGNKRYKVKPELSKNITFKKINLNLDFHRMLSSYDVIFIRNVLIYFNRQTQQSIIEKCWNVLRPGGYLFLGHSETLQGMETKFHYVLPAIYQREIE
jgi:chemotaxis protein methyltransferase CheR